MRKGWEESRCLFGGFPRAEAVSEQPHFVDSHCESQEQEEEGERAKRGPGVAVVIHLRSRLRSDSGFCKRKAA